MRLFSINNTNHKSMLFLHAICAMKLWHNLQKLRCLLQKIIDFSVEMVKISSKISLGGKRSEGAMEPPRRRPPNFSYAPRASSGRKKPSANRIRELNKLQRPPICLFVTGRPAEPEPWARAMLRGAGHSRIKLMTLNVAPSTYRRAHVSFLREGTEK